MPCSTHLAIIKRRVLGQLPILEASRLDVTRHVLTSRLLSEMSTELGHIALYQQWFSALHSASRIRFLSNSDEALYDFPNVNSRDYLIASFFGGQVHFCDAEHAVNTNAPFSEFGIKTNPISEILAINTADNPIFEITLTRGTRSKPQLIEHFFSKEKNISIYDKFYDMQSAHALSIWAARMPPASKIRIYTTPTKRPAANTCKTSMLAANRNLSIQILEATRNTIESVHDRHIFIGNRYHIRFTSGIGVFGDQRGGIYFNNEGAVTIYDVWDSSHPISLEDTNGNATTFRVGKP